MKAFRSTSLLLGIFVLLLLVVVLFGTDNAEKRRNESQTSAPVLSEQQVRQVDQIVFSPAGAEEVTLVKDGEVWMVNGVRVDKSEQEKLEQAIANVETGKMVSKTKENWDKYGVTEGASQVRFMAGEQVVSTQYFGSVGPSYQTVYVRREGDESVYVVNTELDDFLRYDLNRWKNKDLFLFSQEDIQGVTLRIGEERWQFQIQSGDWQWLDGDVWTPVEDGKMDEYMTALLSLRADAIEPDQSLFESADNAIALVSKSGEEYIVSVDKKDEGQVYARITGQPDLFRLPNDLSARLRPEFLHVVEPEEMISSEDESSSSQTE